MTDGSGRFAFPSASRFSPVVPLYGDPWAPLTLCVERSGTWVEMWHVTLLGRSSAPETMSVVCDITPPLRPGGLACRPADGR